MQERGAGGWQQATGNRRGRQTQRTKERAGLDGTMQGGTAGGATSSNTEDRGAGLDGTVLGRAAGGATSSNEEEFNKTLTEKLAKDLNGRKSTETIAEKLANNHTKAIGPGWDSQHAKTVTAKTITAKDTTGRDTDAKDINGSDSYPLVGPRPEKAPDYDHGTSVLSTGADGSLVRTLNVMDKALHSQHL